MRNKTLALGMLGTAALWMAGCEHDDHASAVAEASEHWEMIDRFCTDCHNSAEFAGNLALDRMTPQTISEHPEIWEKAVRKLRGRLMPPPTQPQPDDRTLRAFVASVEDVLDTGAVEPAGSPRIALHRLNRKEYANAVRDILALDVDATQLLPADDRAEGFDNIAAALQVSPSFIEQYVIAARAVAQEAVGRADARPGSKTYTAAPGTQRTHVPGLPLGTRGGIVAVHQFPADGEYKIDIADMASHIWGNDMEFENNVVVTLDGRLVYETVVGGEEDMKRYDQIQDGAMDAINARLKNIRFAATAGPHKVGVAFRRRSFAESDDRLQLFVPGGGQDRIYEVSAFQISGPFSPSGLSQTPSRERIFQCYPSDSSDRDLCAEQIITSLAERAYRRPLAETDVAELLEYYRDGVAAGGFEEGIRSAITGILASPFFLYRAERVPEQVATNGTYRIDDVELASALSFFLWNSIPDAELRQLAAAGQLGDDDVLMAQIDRMLADPRARTLASNFAYQWLDLDRLQEVDPDREVFPYASGSGDPRNDYITEIELFVQSIFDEDRSVVDLLDARHTFLNERLALLYDIHDVKGDRFRRVELDDSARWGLLGKGAVLMAAAYPNRTSPVLRGAFILEHILGTPPASPPPNVEGLKENDPSSGTFRTVRELMQAHSTDPNCFSCHGVMDPLGFALENFDAVGAWRDRDRFAAARLDTTGKLPDGTELEGPDDLRDALLQRSEQFVQTFTERLLMYALGRTLEYYDMPAVRKIVRDAAEDDYRFAAIVRGVVRSEPFLVRRAPDPVSAVTAQVVGD